MYEVGLKGGCIRIFLVQILTVNYRVTEIFVFAWNVDRVFRSLIMIMHTEILDVFENGSFLNTRLNLIDTL